MDYRLYCFDGAGKLWVDDWLEVSSDAEAIELARHMDVGIKCEVWQGRRFVATIESEQRPSGCNGGLQALLT